MLKRYVYTFCKAWSIRVGEGYLQDNSVITFGFAGDLKAAPDPCKGEGDRERDCSDIDHTHRRRLPDAFTIPQVRDGQAHPR